MRYVAHFTPQAWQNNYAVPIDPQGPVQWEVTDWMMRLTEAQRDDVLAQQMQPWDFNDDLRNHPAAPQWIKDFSGPFEIHVKEQS